MAGSRLNKQVFIEADNLASNKGYKKLDCPYPRNFRELLLKL